jgi:hypothetical protein
MRLIAEWLAELGLPQYSELFKANGIDLRVLPDLTERDLEKLGVRPDHRRKMLRAIAEWVRSPHGVATGRRSRSAVA